MYQRNVNQLRHFKDIQSFAVDSMRPQDRPRLIITGNSYQGLLEGPHKYLGLTKFGS
jgi:hypothetical protein